MKRMFIVVLFLAAAFPVHAVTISQWTFDGNIATPSSVASSVTASSFTLSAGAVTFPAGNAPTAPDAISGTGWNVAGGKWWSFTITADPGFQLNLASLAFDDQRSGSGPTGWSVAINGVSAALNQATHSSFSANTIDLSAAAFQGLSSAEVRIFGFGASNANGTWRLDNVILDGEVTPSQSVPDILPFSFAAAALLGVVACGHLLRERSIRT